MQLCEPRMENIKSLKKKKKSEQKTSRTQTQTWLLSDRGGLNARASYSPEKHVFWGIVST